MKILTALALILAFGVTTGIAAQSSADTPKTVDWYMAPENKAALEEKLKECRNNPGQLANTPDCINAQAADLKKFSDPNQPFIQIR